VAQQKREHDARRQTAWRARIASRGRAARACGSADGAVTATGWNLAGWQSGQRRRTRDPCKAAGASVPAAVPGLEPPTSPASSLPARSRAVTLR